MKYGYGIGSATVLVIDIRGMRLFSTPVCGGYCIGKVCCLLGQFHVIWGCWCWCPLSTRYSALVIELQYSHGHGFFRSVINGHGGWSLPGKCTGCNKGWIPIISCI